MRFLAIFSTFQALVAINTAFPFKYSNQPPQYDNNATYELLTTGWVDVQSYPNGTNMSMVNSYIPTINPVGLVRVAELMAGSATPGNQKQRDADILVSLDDLLAYNALPLYARTVHSFALKWPQAQDEIETSTSKIGIPNTIKNFMANIKNFWSDLTLSITSFTRSFKWQPKEFWWSKDFSMIGTPNDMLDMATSIASFVQASSEAEACIGFTYARYDDSQKVDKEHIWIIAGAPYTTGNKCDTKLSNDIMEQKVYSVLTTFRDKKVTTECISFNDSETWHLNLRIAQASAMSDCHLNIWEMDCPEF
ncbi:hypothetical protein ACO0SA_000993 [Hanseniaspora valbyensis]